MNEIYITYAAAVSAQEPLCDSWMESPLSIGYPVAKSIDPDFGSFISPMEGRRMGRLMKRALAVSLTCLRNCGKECPDAIFTGTGMGCLEHTEAFMDGMSPGSGAVMKPTHFMQSTHNTLGSLIAIKTGCHGYNATYSHRGVSFESALEDAVTRLQTGHEDNALVCAFDEITPRWADLFGRMGYAGEGTPVPAGEAAVAFMMERDCSRAWCRFSGMRLLYRPSPERICCQVGRMLADEGLGFGDISLVVAGYNGVKENDDVYDRVLSMLCPDAPAARYRHLFGESYSVSALGMYVAAACLRNGRVPECLIDGRQVLEPENILVVNHSAGRDLSFILLRRIKSCGR